MSYNCKCFNCMKDERKEKLRQAVTMIGGVLLLCAFFVTLYVAMTIACVAMGNGPEICGL